MFCPKCHAKIPAEKLYPEYLCGVCSSCQLVLQGFPDDFDEDFSDSDLADFILLEGDDFSTQNRVELNPRRQELKIYESQATIRKRLDDLYFFSFVAICAAVMFAGFACTKFEGFPRAVSIPATILFLLLGLALLYAIVATYHRVRVFCFTPKRLRVETVCFAKRTQRTIDRARILRAVQQNQCRLLYDRGRWFSFSSSYVTPSRKNLNGNYLGLLINDYLDATEKQRFCCPRCGRGVLVDPNHSQPEQKRRCRWCKARYTVEEAKHQGEKDRLDAERFRRPIRPLCSRLLVEETEDSLTINVRPWGVLTATEYLLRGMCWFFGLYTAVVFALFITVGIPRNDWDWTVIVMLLMFMFIYLFFRYYFLKHTRQESQIVLNSKEIQIETKIPWFSALKETIPRTNLQFSVRYELNHWAVSINDEKGAIIKIRCLDFLEEHWLAELLKNFLIRTSPAPQFRLKIQDSNLYLALIGNEPTIIDTHCPKCDEKMNVDTIQWDDWDVPHIACEKCSH